MILFMFTGVLIVSYILTFKDDFTNEEIQHSAPFIIGVYVLVTLLGSLR